MPSFYASASNPSGVESSWPAAPPCCGDQSTGPWRPHPAAWASLAYVSGSCRFTPNIPLPQRELVMEPILVAVGSQDRIRMQRQRAEALGGHHAHLVEQRQERPPAAAAGAVLPVFGDRLVPAERQLAISEIGRAVVAIG